MFPSKTYFTNKGQICILRYTSLLGVVPSRRHRVVSVHSALEFQNKRDLVGPIDYDRVRPSPTKDDLGVGVPFVPITY
jgi:hypothetical protein